MSEFRYATRGRAQRQAILKTFEGQSLIFDRTAEMTFDAWDMMFRGDLEAARALAQEVLVLQGENIDALNTLGEISILAGDLKKAEEYLLQAVNAAEPTKPAQSGDPADALRRMHWTMGFFQTLESIAALCIEQGINDQAIEVLERLPSTAFPYLPWSALVLARLYTVKRNPEKALAAMKNCTNFRFPGIAYDVALCHIMLGDALSAIQALREGFFQSPYIACEILGEPVPTEIRRGSPDDVDSQAKQIAARYAQQMGEAWRAVPGATDLLKDLWNHPAVKAETREYCDIADRADRADRAGDREAVKEAAGHLSELLNAKRIKETSAKIAAELRPLPPRTMAGGKTDN